MVVYSGVGFGGVGGGGYCGGGLWLVSLIGVSGFTAPWFVWVGLGVVVL